jgi:hypothetical protein
MIFLRPSAGIIGMLAVGLIQIGSASAVVFEGSCSGEECVVRCTGANCQNLADEEGCREEMPDGTAWVFRREDNACSQNPASEEDAENLDQGQQTSDDMIAAGEARLPGTAGGGGPTNDENTTTDSPPNESQRGGTSEDDVQSPIEINDLDSGG